MMADIYSIFNYLISDLTRFWEISYEYWKHFPQIMENFMEFLYEFMWVELCIVSDMEQMKIVQTQGNG